MKKVPGLVKIIQNKYLIAVISFMAWILFFDRNDLFTQWDRKQELNRLELSKNYYTSEISTIKRDISQMDNNPAIIEKIAREKYFLKRSNEDIFIVEDSSALKK